MNLVIGNTSQLAHYFPSDMVKISSRNIKSNIFDTTWDSVYLCFAEQKTYKNNDDSFYKINVDYTKSIIKKLKANHIIYFSTAELWNNCNGAISLDTPINYHYSDYISSKENITSYLKTHYSNVRIMYPFNFNSIYRLPPFLFGKIIDSIRFKNKIEIGDTHFYRELLHPSFVVNQALTQKTDSIIGTGNTIFINSFIKKLYNNFGMNYDDYVIENIDKESIYRKNVFYNKTKIGWTESQLLDILTKEINDTL
jgi:nucleoside-diphosphate-sugar epimerase